MLASRRYRNTRACAALLSCAFLCGAPRARADGELNLLRGKTPIRSSGVLRAAVLTDGESSAAGGYWKTQLTSVFDDTNSFVEYDLGAVQRVRAAWLAGDNNDSYRVALSNDGHVFRTLWDAPPAPRPGMQARSTQALAGEGRYVRLRPLRGDGKFAIDELQLFANTAAELPAPATFEAPELDSPLRDRAIVFAMALLALLLVPERARPWLLGAGLAVAAVAGARFVSGIFGAWPVEAQEVSLIRGTIAFVGAAALAREAFAPRRWPASRAIVACVLAGCAALGLLAFYNLGHAQFYNQHIGRWSFAHHADLRQYYPTAKYFRELSYFRMYDADLAVLASERRQGLHELAELPVRDLQSFAVGRVGDRAAEVAAIKGRFTKQRWAAYTRDAGWFQRTMGTDAYLDSLRDYGGNATPVWMAIAHGLFTLIPPGDFVFTCTALIDPVLLFAMFVAILRVFGWRIMLVSAIVFGANDFVMYGTNWSGATLRHDWLAYLGFGMCALRRERFLLAGALLGLATMIRAFPALALGGAVLPALWRIAERAFTKRELPRLRELYERERGSVLIALGALCTLLGAALIATLVLGPEVWGEWIDKVAKIESDPHPACVALRNLIAGSEDQARILRARWPLYAAVLAFCVGAVALVSRHARPERAAILGLSLVPVVLYPANYYLHFVFLLPLLADPSAPVAAVEARPPARDVVPWLIVLAMCALQYFTTLVAELPLHFYLSTVTLFAMLGALYSWLLAHDESVRRWFEA